MSEYWLKQENDKPLFQDILWSRPENRQTAGKLLIIGGSLHSFANVGAAYQTAVKAGVGTARVLLPDSLKKIVGNVLETQEFAASNPSGSFSRQALNEMLIQAAWADAVLLAGDFGRNSETAILLESFVQKYQGLLVIAGDSLDYFLHNPSLALKRDKTCIAGTFAQLQKLLTSAKCTPPITSNMELSRLVEILHEFSTDYPAHLLTSFGSKYIVVSENRVCTTPIKTGGTELNAARAAVFWVQNPAKPFAAFSTSAI